MASPQEVVLAPSELNTHPAQYDHAEVYVKGYLKLGPESHILYESKELDEEFKRRWDSGGSDFDPRNYQKYCLTIGNPDLLYKNRSKLVGQTLTIKGRFTAAYLDAQHIDLGACPLPTAIIIDEADLKQRYHLP
jgi:hypothetical protein